jgi:glutamate carboxypeptidase
MSSLQSALSALARRAPEILGLVEQLVRVNSHSKNVVGVDRVGELLCSALASLPLQVRSEDGAPWGRHLCFSTAAANAQRPFLLIGHHDTVFPPGIFETYRTEGERAFGPGVLDMKGGLSVIITALRCLHDAGILEHTPLRFVSVADEEVGSPTSRVFLAELAANARAALVFESGRAGDAIVTSRRGSGYVVATAHGRAAHAGNALHEGRNAVWALAKFIDKAQRLNGAVPGANVSTGLVQGGTARNTVPAEAEAQLDVRFDDLAAQQALVCALRECAERAGAQVEGTRLELALHVTRPPLVRTEASLALCERYAACQMAAGLLASEAPRQGGGSDANTVAALGVPAIDGLGPRGRGYHTQDEVIEIPTLALKTEALLRFLLSEGYSETE